MKILAKGLLGAGAAAVLVTVAAPTQAQSSGHYDRNRDGLSVGEVIAGAVVLGGLVAVIAAADDDRYSRYGSGYRRSSYDNGYYNRNGGSRAAINQCVDQAERWAGRYRRSNVTQIREIDRTRYGYRVRGNLVVQDGWRGDLHNRHGYGNRYDRGDDQGRFTCYVERGRVIDIDYSGLDQWRD